jgi:uncharacterized protein YggL (DUF469 family)
VRKRLRKKLHVGEFQELGFEVRFQVADNLSYDAFDTVVDAFISQAIEAHGLLCGGGGTNPEWSVFVTRVGRGSATEGHRQAIETWLVARPRSIPCRLVRSSMLGIPPKCFSGYTPAARSQDGTVL